MKFYTHYNRPPKVVTELDTDTLFVSQSEADTVSLGYQLQRYGMDGLEARFESMKSKFGYADCTKLGDFADIQNRYRKGVEYFEALPSEIRAEFKHRPELFYDYLEKNQSEATKRGFINAPKVDNPVIENTVDTGTSQVVERPVETQNPVEKTEG